MSMEEERRSESTRTMELHHSAKKAASKTMQFLRRTIEHMVYKQLKKKKQRK